MPANPLYLVSLALVLVLGSAVQAWRIWPGVIVTGLFLILLSALLLPGPVVHPRRRCAGIDGRENSGIQRPIAGYLLAHWYWWDASLRHPDLAR